MNKSEEIVAAMEDYAVRYNVPIITKEGVALLAKTVIERQPCSILEIGTAIGYSTLHMALNQPANGRIATIEINPARIELARNYLFAAGIIDKVDLLLGDAGDIIPRLDSDFDMLFIDAAKGQYLDYLNKATPMLLPGAAIVTDNILFRGWVYGSNQDTPRRFRTIVKRLRAYLDFIMNDSRFDTTIFPVGDGDGMAISYYKGKEKN
ncbi:MAG TPA: O-methyltransferase [Methylomusa anaerophila]|uniref:tRNA 5-hydroxyuridine methyltransferase n=1 Tax=Methylomusa anaerophila TaxID=1930071 RepID=A0A348APA0_9FIRM|nr:O-methyltransferase [Methylomusa anaerophila]BBB92898.1 putative O-methyltransferase/MSMEI_4947 [Methylomusa anaerophila]HML87266.1 O-methyltransferase [Methylomusa anaerophila]